MKSLICVSLSYTESTEQQTDFVPKKACGGCFLNETNYVWLFFQYANQSSDASTFTSSQLRINFAGGNIYFLTVKGMH